MNLGARGTALALALAAAAALSACASPVPREAPPTAEPAIEESCTASVDLQPEGEALTLQGNTRIAGGDGVADVRIELHAEEFSTAVCTDTGGQWQAFVPFAASYTLTVVPATVPTGITLVMPETGTVTIEPHEGQAVLSTNFLFEADATPATADALLELDVENVEGYTYSLHVQSASVTPVVNVADAKPGEVLVDIELGAAATTTNTTSGRNAPSSGAVIAPYWLLDSPVCAVAHKLEETFCWFPNTSLSLVTNAQGDLGSGETIAMPTGIPNGANVVVEEAARDAFIAAATAPAGFLVFGENLRTSAGTQGCLVANFTYVVGATGPRADLGC